MRASISSPWNASKAGRSAISPRGSAASFPDKQANNRDGSVAAVGLTPQMGGRYQGRIRGRNKKRNATFTAPQSTWGVPPPHASRGPLARPSGRQQSSPVHHSL